MANHINERSNLLDDSGDVLENSDETGSSSSSTYLPPARVLPLALFSALAMSSTSATAYFTYTILLCKDQTQCMGREINRFAGYVAVATAASNVIGMIALGPLQKITKTKLKLGLSLWIAVRSMSPIMLFLGSQ